MINFTLTPNVTKFKVKKMSISENLKDFFGFFILNPFEKHLINSLGNILNEKDKKRLKKQLEHCSRSVRFLEPSTKKNSYGYTELYYKDDSQKIDQYLFDNSASRDFAEAKVKFSESVIDVKFIIHKNRLFSLRYYSKDKIYYPTSDYSIEITKL